MDSEDNLQDLVRCVSCDTPNPILHCDICHIPLCKSCVGEHLLDESKEHKVVSFKDRGHNPKCLKHFKKFCDLYCEGCDNPICLECVSSGKHLGHKQTSISNKLETKKNELQKDLHELQNSIYPTYEKFASNIPVQIANLKENSKNLTAAIDKHGENMHREINTAIEELKSDLDDFDTKNLAVLNKQEEEIKSSISEINQIIDKLKELQNCNDFRRVSAYKSRNDEFNKLPPKLFLPRFTPKSIQKEQFGFLSINTDHKMNTKATHGNSKDSSDSVPYPPDRPLIDVPRIITEINTYTAFGATCTDLRCVSCLSDKEVWTCGTDNIMRLYNLKGQLLKSIQTGSGKKPGDIAVVRSGELVYTDLNLGSVNMVHNRRIRTLISLYKWGPLNVCSTYSGDLLVVMISENKEETRIVRYSGSTEKQIIQNNDEGKPLYSSVLGPKYISENRNQDICVADNTACTIVVVNLAGKHRFTYTGPELTYERPFYPRGITTDSQSRILTADHYSQCIHIIDQDGQFLRYIDNLYGDHDWPWGLCVDSKDNLFVTDFKKGTVRKIQYCMETTAIMK